MLRGGSFDVAAFLLRSADRYRYFPALARDVTPVLFAPDLLSLSSQQKEMRLLSLPFVFLWQFVRDPAVRYDFGNQTVMSSSLGQDEH